MRVNGVLVAQIAPRGLVIGGTSSIVQLDAWDWEQAAYSNDAALPMHWPEPTTPRMVAAPEMVSCKRSVRQEDRDYVHSSAKHERMHGANTGEVALRWKRCVFFK